MFVWLVAIAVVVSGCGSLSYESSSSSAASASGQSQNKKPSSGQPESGSKQCCDTGSPQNDSSAPIPPVPVVGSFLAGFVTGMDGAPLVNSTVVLEETGLPPVTKTSDANGLVRLEIADPNNIERISVQRRVAGITVENLVVLTVQQRQLAAGATYSAGVSVPQNLLEMRVAADGSPLVLGGIMNPALDKAIPKINYSSMPRSEGQVELIITGSDAESGLHPQPYSFDGGATWTTQTRWTLPAGYTIQPGQIQVRDRAGNKNVINGTITL